MVAKLKPELQLVAVAELAYTGAMEIGPTAALAPRQVNGEPAEAMVLANTTAGVIVLKPLPIRHRA